MRTTCLVNNYNYRRFLSEAIDSALRQTAPLDEIIVVDDGSTDGSLELLNKRYGAHPRVQIIAKENEGQLSCFNVGFARSTGDVVFFLDADDVFADNYVETALGVYERSPSHDCVISAYKTFGHADVRSDATGRDVDLGYSVIAAWFLKTWLGNSTSCLSFRRSLLARILPLPWLDDWRVQADVCLVFGSSLVGGKKFKLGAPLVNYRVHSDNHFIGRSLDNETVYRHRLARNRLFGHFLSAMQFDLKRLPEFAHWEYGTANPPTAKRLKHYTRIVMTSQIPLRHRLKSVAWMACHYWLGFHRQPGPPLQIAAQLPQSGPPPTTGDDDVDHRPPTIPLRRAA